MKTYINGILISALLLMFTFDFISQTLTFNHIDLYESNEPMITQHNQHITIVVNKKDSTINFFWDEFETHYLYEMVDVKELSSNNQAYVIYDVSNSDRNIEITHYKDEGVFNLNVYKDTGDNVTLHVYNDNE